MYAYYSNMSKSTPTYIRTYMHIPKHTDLCTRIHTYTYTKNIDKENDQLQLAVYLFISLTLFGTFLRILIWSVFTKKESSFIRLILFTSAT